MIYEMRVYRPVPGRLPALLKRFEEHHAETLGEARHQAGRFLDHAGRRLQPRSEYLLAWESLADRERKWNAFRAIRPGHRPRDESEKDGPILANASNQILRPTAFSAVK